MLHCPFASLGATSCLDELLPGLLVLVSGDQLQKKGNLQ